ncbi:Complex I intermediate-associated protein 30, mitochondrial [Eumeta japonica]|uniref:Complex I intermediate-associated protein 30, mitochondrial n=1 Tax=Eumeta variegata TaxID=151549 RepID=A0A4C1XUX2_EUMVA|nr:Complex I intermediate-associated protein 30, mitochondrial [Eumeta japonica]
MRLGFGQLKGELALFWQEMKDLWEQDPCLIARPGETDLIWCFNNSTVLDNFVTTCDSDHNEGFSKCSLEMSPAGRALFHGYLDVRVPKDGKVKRAGYCSFRSKRVRIPFSKFVLGSKGRLQDKQNRIKSDKVTHIGIACGDKIPGEFELEIEYIGLEFDPTHDEEFAYEMYKTERYIHFVTHVTHVLNNSITPISVRYAYENRRLVETQIAAQSSHCTLGGRRQGRAARVRSVRRTQAP